MAHVAVAAAAAAVLLAGMRQPTSAAQAETTIWVPEVALEVLSLVVLLALQGATVAVAVVVPVLAGKARALPAEPVPSMTLLTDLVVAEVGDIRQAV